MQMTLPYSKTSTVVPLLLFEQRLQFPAGCFAGRFTVILRSLRRRLEVFAEIAALFVLYPFRDGWLPALSGGVLIIKSAIEADVQIASATAAFVPKADSFLR
jgi:hypothetical protein